LATSAPTLLSILFCIV